MVQRPIRAGSRTTVHGSCGADLIAAVGQLRSLGYTFGEAGCRRRNIPKDPVRLIVGGLVASQIQVVHMEEKTVCASGRVGPIHRWRRTLSGGNPRGGLTKLNGNLAAVRKSRNGQGHGRRGRRGAAFRRTSLRRQQDVTQNVTASKQRNCMTLSYRE